MGRKINTQLELDLERLVEARDRLQPGSRAYDLSTPAGRLLLVGDRRIAEASLTFLTELLERLQTDLRSTQYDYRELETMIRRAYGTGVEMLQSGSTLDE